MFTSYVIASALNASSLVKPMIYTNSTISNNADIKNIFENYPLLLMNFENNTTDLSNNNSLVSSLSAMPFHLFSEEFNSNSVSQLQTNHSTTKSSIWQSKIRRKSFVSNTSIFIPLFLNYTLNKTTMIFFLQDQDRYTTSNSINEYNNTCNRTVNSTNIITTKKKIMGRNNSCYKFRYVFCGYICTIVIIFGIIGNSISICVLHKDKHNKVPVFLLQTLAVADNVLLVIFLIVFCIMYGFLPNLNRSLFHIFAKPIAYYVNPTGHALQSIVIWVTFLLSVNRYVAICKPFSAKRLLTISSARIQVGAVVILSFLLCIPHWIMIRDLQSYKTEFVIVEIVYLILLFVFPILLIIGLNIPIIQSLQNSKNNMRQNSLVYNGRQETSITIVMIIIVAELVICQLPNKINKIIEKATYSKFHNCHNPQFYVNIFFNLLVTINSSTDFIIYVCFRRRFRQLLFKSCFPWCKRTDTGSLQTRGSETEATLGLPRILVNFNRSKSCSPAIASKSIRDKLLFHRNLLTSFSQE